MVPPTLLIRMSIRPYLVSSGHDAFGTFPGFQVSLQGQGFDALLPQVGGHALHIVGNVHQHQPGALGAGQFGNPLADALGGAGDDHHLAAEAGAHATSSAVTLGVKRS